MATTPLQKQNQIVIIINYTNGQKAEVPLVDILSELLIPEKGAKGRPVVFFEEGNFTFSVAFASMRRSWDGITATRYLPFSPDDDTPDELQFADVKLMAIECCTKNGNKLKDTDAKILDKVSKLLDLQNPPVGTRLFGIDATRSPACLDVRGKVVWFQCPRREEGIDDLIAVFLSHMKEKQSPGDYALIGTIKKSLYVLSHKLETLRKLDVSHAQEQIYSYKFLGVDETMIKDILLHGYGCRGRDDIYDDIEKDHITLVFCRL